MQNSQITLSTPPEEVERIVKAWAKSPEAKKALEKMQRNQEAAAARLGRAHQVDPLLMIQPMTI